ncbi:26115_t:CDS:2, partial [Gigaspora margarita]
NVPIFYQRWLSPIHLSCSLGCAENSNCFAHYHHFTGTFGLSKNIRVLYLYLEILAAQNIGEKTIYSQLKICSSSGNHMSLALNNQETCQLILNTEVIIINKISMISASLLTFISNLFARLYNNALPFGGIRDLLIGDLAQLPPVNVLNEIRNEQISNDIMQIINNKIKTPSTRSPTDTTYLVGFHAIADNLNKLACLSLPQEYNNSELFVTTAIDFINSQEIDPINNN